MLEKRKGNIKVDKLKAILLLETNLNTLYKIIFNGRVLPHLEANKQILIEIISRQRGYLAYHITLNKKLILEISNQINNQQQ